MMRDNKMRFKNKRVYPKSVLMEAIEKNFGNVKNFKEHISSLCNHVPLDPPRSDEEWIKIIYHPIKVKFDYEKFIKENNINPFEEIEL